METLEKLRGIWAGLSVNNRVLLVVLTAGMLVAAVVTVRWVRDSNYTTLYTQLSPEEGGEIIDALSALGVPYRISGGGTAILVPQGQAQSARLKMAAQGYPRAGAVGYEIFDKSNLGMTDFLQRVNFRRALEGEIAKSIMSLSEVAAARVHLVIPEQRLFSRDQKAPTASVVLKLNRPLAPGQVSAIEHLVASSVEGLSTDHVAIIDFKGKLLSARQEEDPDARLSSTQLELRKNVEQHLESKAQSMLDGTLGPGRSVVRVMADLNFAKVEKSAEIFDPDRVAVRSEETSTLRGDAEGGQQNSTITNYEISKSVERVVSAYGNIQRLSMAIIVDGTYAPAADPEAPPVYQPRSAEELQKIGALVRTAVGFDSARSDRLEVVNLAFEPGLLDDAQRELTTISNWATAYDIGKKVLLGMLLLGAAFYVRKGLRRLGEALEKATPVRRPAAPPAPGAPDLSAERQRVRLADVFGEHAKGKPEEVAKIIKTMMLD